MDASKSDIESLMEAIMQLVRDANRLAAESLEYTRIQVLRLMLARGPTSMIDIATALDMAPSAVVRNLRALEEQEMVSVVEGSGTAGGGATGCLVATVTPAGIEEVRRKWGDKAAAAARAHITADLNMSLWTEYML